MFTKIIKKIKKHYTIYTYICNGVDRDKITYVEAPHVQYIDGHSNFKATMRMKLKYYTLTSKQGLDISEVNSMNFKGMNLVTFIKGRNKYRYCGVD